MKRNYHKVSQNPNEKFGDKNTSQRNKGKVTPIFVISTKAPQSTHDSFSEELNSYVMEDTRVGASSRVNFSKLSPKEQKQRFVNQFEEIKRLRAKMKKHSKVQREDCNDDIQKALKLIYEAHYDVPDQCHLIEDVAAGVISGQLRPDTLAFNQISTILRDLLGVECHDAKHTISLPEVTVPISTLEYEIYRRIPCTDRVLRNLLGRKQKQPEDPNELFSVLKSYGKT